MLRRIDPNGLIGAGRSGGVGGRSAGADASVIGGPVHRLAPANKAAAAIFSSLEARLQGARNAPAAIIL